MKQYSFEQKLLVASWLLFLLSMLLPSVVVNHKTLMGYEVAIAAMSLSFSIKMSLMLILFVISSVGNVVSLFSILFIFLFKPSRKKWLLYLIILCILLIVAALLNMSLIVSSRLHLHLGAYLWLVSYILLLSSIIIAHKRVEQ